MEAKAHLKYIRISPRKVSIVLDLIRGKDTETAMAILKNTNKIAAEHLVKLLKSAIANAEHNNNLSRDDLYVAEIFADGGPILKRVNPVSKGRAYRINKRTSHITVILDTKEAK